jgi:hypothetical protein
MRFHQRALRSCLVALALLAPACAKQAAPAAMRSGAIGYAGDYDVPAEELAYAEPSMMPAAPAMAPSPSRGGRKGDDGGYAPPPPPPPPPGQPPEPAPQQAPARMVHYEGYAQLRHANPVELLDEIVAVAEAAGGRTERLAGTTVSVRVPVAAFEETYAKILALGDVMSKSVRADDVTDQFLAVDLRVKNLRTTRDRLVQLLAKATDENEKLRLLAEITRVTEELDAFESQLRTLSDLASMSRISVDAVAREAFANASQRPEMHGFEWIRGLSPFNRGVWGDDKRVPLAVPDGLVALSKTGPFAAESADGVVTWTMRLPNDPVGDAAYWVDAVEDRLAAEFQNPSERTLGAWRCLELDQPGADEPYHWSICARTTGDKLDVGQVYYPSPAMVERYGKAVEAAFTGGGDS